MAADAGQGFDLGRNLDFLVEQLDALCSIHQNAAEGPDRLVPDKENHALRTPEVVLEMMADTAGIAHAAGRDDDLGRFVLVDGHGFLLADSKLQAGEHQRVNARTDFIPHLFVQIRGVTLQENACRLNGEGAVHIDREIAVPGDKTPCFDLADKIQDLLRPAHSKGGDDHIAAPVQDLLNP